MKIEHGDILSVKEGIIIHGCNCQGKMDSGLAKSIREMYPAVFDEYERYHNIYSLELGDIIPVQVSQDLIIINAMTQKFYGRDGKRYVNYGAIAKTFSEIIDFSFDFGGSINFPAIGCGLGGGDFDIIFEIISLLFESKYVEGTLWLPEIKL